MKKLNKQAAMTNLLIFIAVVIVINLISLNLFFRLDFSRGKVYSLSPASKAALRQLDDRVLVRAFFTQDLPPDLANIRRYTRDLLEEYKTYSGGKFRYEFINPNDDRLREEAQRSGVPPVNVNVRERDRIEVRQAYLGLVFHYEDRTEVIQLVQETRGLEYEITKAIMKIAALGMPKVAFYGHSPEIPQDPWMRMFFQQQDRFQQAKTNISQHYEMVETTLNEPIPNDVNTLVFTGVLDSLGTHQLYHIDQFLMKGNSIVFFQARVNANLQNQQAQPIHSNIFNLLEHYGVQIADNLVMDANSNRVNVQEQVGFTIRNTAVNYPFLIIANEVNKNHPIVSQLENVNFAFVSELDNSFEIENVRLTPLIQSSNSSGTMMGPNYWINVQQFMDRSYLNRLNERGKVIAGLYDGVFSSFFAEQGTSIGGDFIESTSNGRIVVVPDMDFITSSGGGRNPSNINFLMNSIDYLSGIEGLIMLRSREVTNKPLVIERLVKTEDLTPEGAERRRSSMREFIKFANIVLPAILVVVYGLLRYRLEIKRRKRIKETYE